MIYLNEFLMLTLVHFLAVISPGPDFAVVVRQSISFGRSTALITSLGIGVGISIHLIYTLLGLGFIISQSAILFTIMKSLGALYLSYLGIKLLFSKAPTQNTPPLTITIDPNRHHHKRAFMLGFMTNLFNPKATLFFVAIFTTIVSVDTPITVQSLYGLWLCISTTVWFSMVSFFFSQQKIRNQFIRYSYLFDRLMGGVLLIFAVRLVFLLT